MFLDEIIGGFINISLRKMVSVAKPEDEIKSIFTVLDKKKTNSEKTEPFFIIATNFNETSVA